MFIRNMKVVGKISLLAGILITFLVGVGWYSIQQMAQLDQALDAVFANQLLPITHITAFRHAIMENALLVSEHIITTDAEAMLDLEAKLNATQELARGSEGITHSVESISIASQLG